MGKVLIACEKSQEVCKAFRNIGHEAYSCDIDDCTGGYPQWHIKKDAIDTLYSMEWDLVVAHPPCTRLANSGVHWLEKRNLWAELNEAIDFFKKFLEYGDKGNKIVIENPIPHKYARNAIGKYTQIIQPYQFGHPESKATCLWIKNLPLLKPTINAYPSRYRCACGNIYSSEYGEYGCCGTSSRPVWDNQTKSGQNNLPPSKHRAELRSRTYPGIAKAIAEQYGNLI